MNFHAEKEAWLRWVLSWYPVAHLLATAALWVESRHLLKIQNGRHKQRTRQNLAKKYTKREASSPPEETSVIQNADYLRFSYFCGYLALLAHFAPILLSPGSESD